MDDSADEPLDMVAIVHSLLRQLHPIEQWVLRERFGTELPRRKKDAWPFPYGTLRQPEGRDGYYYRSHEGLASDSGLSVERIQQIEQTALEKLRGMLTAD
jgi:DNA-directed RNA polymerase sigma subunit (sigma70/sigma32)